MRDQIEIIFGQSDGTIVNMVYVCFMITQYSPTNTDLIEDRITIQATSSNFINSMQPPSALRGELKTWVRSEIGPVATPDAIQFARGLPKICSGKIMRRILHKIADGKP